MKDAATLQAEFMTDLNALLRRHCAEIQVTDDGKSYGMQGGVCEVSISSRYNDANECVREGADFELDTWMDGYPA